MKDEIYLITCCKEKDSNGVINSSVFNLSFNELLGNCRKELIAHYEQTYGQLNWNKCMTAIDRYKGRTLYSEEVKNAIQKRNSKVLIVSALFGIIKPNDLIPNYNLKMDDKINGIYVFDFWREKLEMCEKCILNSVLISNKNDENKIYINLLSKVYQKAFYGFTDNGIPALDFIPNLIYPPVKEEVDFNNKMGHWKRDYLLKRLR